MGVMCACCCRVNITQQRAHMTRIVHLYRQVSTVKLTVVSFLYKNTLVMSSFFLKFVIVLTNFVSSNSVSNHTRDKQVVLQTNLISAQFYLFSVAMSTYVDIVLLWTSKSSILQQRLPYQFRYNDN